MKDTSISEEIMDLTERVSLLEVTRQIAEDARPVHVVRSKYHILGDSYIKSQNVLSDWLENQTEAEVWKAYPDKLRELQSFLSPKVAKELLDAFLQQKGI